MQKILGFTAANGIHFIALSIELNGKHAIEFFDTRYPECKSPLTKIPGQFISHYYADTLANHEGGLCLEGGVDDWQIDAASVELVKRALIPSSYQKALDKEYDDYQEQCERANKIPLCFDAWLNTRKD